MGSDGVDSTSAAPTEVERHPVEHLLAGSNASTLELDKLVGNHIRHAAVLHTDALRLARRTWSSISHNIVSVLEVVTMH
jgi:hypothetical protein